MLSSYTIHQTNRHQIPLSSFSWEEVETWGRLNSPRVLQLYGAVQEGLNVVLFMDLKTGIFRLLFFFFLFFPPYSPYKGTGTREPVYWATNTHSDIKPHQAIVEILHHALFSGSLAQFLKTRGHFPEDLALYYHYQVLQALEHLHSRKVIHLDVKGEHKRTTVDYFPVMTWFRLYFIPLILHNWPTNIYLPK